MLCLPQALSGENRVLWQVSTTGEPLEWQHIFHCNSAVRPMCIWLAHPGAFTLTDV